MNKERTILDWIENIVEKICPICMESIDNENYLSTIMKQNLDVINIKCGCVKCDILYRINVYNMEADFSFTKNTKRITVRSNIIELTTQMPNTLFASEAKFSLSLKNIFRLTNFKDIENEIIKTYEIQQLLT